MNTTTTISIGIDPAVKKAAAANAKAAGANLSALVRDFVDWLAREPDAAQGYRRPNPVTLKTIRDGRAGIGLHCVNSLEELYKEAGWENWE
jgi:antitoxin component of RelBE/YafQ-DinJ toxin-antitoxin module